MCDVVHTREFRATAARRGIAGKAPHIVAIKWGTFGQFCQWLREHRGRIASCLDELGRGDLVQVLESKEWRQWSLVAIAFLEFTNAIQADSAYLAEGKTAYKELHRRLEELSGKGNVVAAEYLPILGERMSQTENDVLLDVAYLLTEPGLFQARARFHRARLVPVLSPLEVAAEALHELETIDELCRKFVEVAAIFSADVRADTLAFVGVFKSWVTDRDALPPFGPSRDPIAYWRMRHLEWNASCDQRRHLALAAMVMLSVPCSEAAAERLFSALDWVLDPRRHRLSIEVLSNEMLIRMWQVYTNTLAGLPFVTLAERDPGHARGSA